MVWILILAVATIPFGMRIDGRRAARRRGFHYGSFINGGKVIAFKNLH